MILEKITEGTKAAQYKAKVQCDICGVIRVVKWWTAKFKQEHLCRGCATTRSRTGKKASEQAKKNMSKAQRKNGYRMQGNGYKAILIDDKQHPRYKDTKGGGYIMEHILTMEKELGRFLKKNEMIHHIDRNKLNNNIDNLYLISEESLAKSRKTHNKAHQSAEMVTIELYKLGIVEFKDGVYKIKNKYANELTELAAKLL